MPKKPVPPSPAQTVTIENRPSPRWRVGRTVPINVYDGDRPVCQCQTAVDARRIVSAVNGRYSHMCRDWRGK